MKVGRVTLVDMRFGSHLYGTSTPESDLDYKGVFLPAWDEVLLQRAPKSESRHTGSDHSKNTAADCDWEMYLLHYFVELACQGQTVALDMMHAPRETCVVWSDAWGDLVANRTRFYTRNLNAFVGYARKQAAKYGVKGSRLAEAEGLKRYLRGFDEDLRLSEVWDGLPQGEHTRPAEADPKGQRQFEVCGRKFGERARVGNALAMLTHFIEKYGERARLAAQNKGIDWKAVSHALRAAYQVKELLAEGTITFPRPEAPYLLQVKAGSLDYLKEVGPTLEGLMDEVGALSETSALPDKVDRGWWRAWLLLVMDGHMKEHYGARLQG